ncbi:hypothetical protein BGZ70_000858, partial [Mortierella alpina]
QRLFATDNQHLHHTLSDDDSEAEESMQQGRELTIQEHEVQADHEDAARALRPLNRRLFATGNHHSHYALSSDDSDAEESMQQHHEPTSQEHDTRVIHEDADGASHPSDQRLFATDNQHLHHTLSDDDSEAEESMQQGRELTIQEHEVQADHEDAARALRPLNRRLFATDDRHSQHTLSDDDCEAEEPTQQSYRPDSSAFHGRPIESTSVARPPLSARNGNDQPQDIDRGYRSEMVVADMASLPVDGNRYHADGEFMTPVMDRPRRTRTTPPIADGFESDDESDDDQTIGNSANPSSTSARRAQVNNTQKENHNPFIHIPEPQNAEAIHRERARRRAEARDNLGYVIRGQKYSIYPSLYEESEDPELYGSTVLWPSESSRNDAAFTFSCPTAQNPDTIAVDEDDEDDNTPAKYGMTLLPIPKRTHVISDTSQADSSEDEQDHHLESSSGDSLARPLQSLERPSPTIVDLFSEDTTLVETREEDQASQSEPTIRIADSWMGSTKRPLEDAQPERASKAHIDASRQPSFAGPFQALKEGPLVERGGPALPAFDFSVGAAPALAKVEEAPKWYRLSKSTEEEEEAEEGPRWYRLSKSTTTVRMGSSSSMQEGGGSSGSHRGYGSSTYGSGDEDSDSGALNRSFDFEFKPVQPLSGSGSRPAKGHGLAIKRAEKHRLEPDPCRLLDDDGSGEHLCSAFEGCWGRRAPVVGLYYWDEEAWEEGRAEERKDKRFVLIRDPSNDD